MSKFKEKTVRSTLLYQGRIVSLQDIEVVLPNGKTSHREVVGHKGAVAVIALTEDQKVVLIRQFRKPVEEEIWELPAGVPAAGEAGEAAAKRELEEETGFVAAEIKEIFQAYASPGYSAELIRYYLARSLKKTRQALDEDEIIEVRLVPLPGALEMIRKGEIKDNKTVAGLLMLSKWFL